MTCSNKTCDNFFHRTRAIIDLEDLCKDVDRLKVASSVPSVPATGGNETGGNYTGSENKRQKTSTKPRVLKKAVKIKKKKEAIVEKRTDPVVEIHNHRPKKQWKPMKNDKITNFFSVNNQEK